MDFLGKTLEFIGKFSWPVMVAAGFVLFVPSGAAEQIGISEIREKYQGITWIIFVLSAAIWLHAVFKYLESKLFSYIEEKRKENRKLQQEVRRQEVLVSRLSSLASEELMWLKYCLFFNTQTLASVRNDSIAQSLTFKGILVEGCGDVLSLPFHINDQVWKILKENKSSFLPEHEEKDPSFANVLRKFRDGRSAY